MNYAQIFDDLRTIEDLCLIAAKHASKEARAEVVGRCSGRTLDDILAQILEHAHDCKAWVKAGMPAV